MSSSGAVRWLALQALLFGAVAAVLGVVANAMFLEAYGSSLLPVTYVWIGIAGALVSAGIARSTGRFDLVGIATVVLGAAALAFLVTWLLARDGGAAWVSWPLLVAFPILIQLGFVFLGGQAGRILDIAGIKAAFPRIMTAFPVGAVLGGLACGPIASWAGSVETLLLGTALLQAAFAGTVWATGRRYRSLLALAPPAPAGTVSGGPAPEEASVSLRTLFASPFVRLVLGYQVLSALGSQVADFLVFDRAAVAFPDAEALARFVGGYTAAMNALSIAFLFVLAGPLLRRYGLRLGITANPVVVTAFAALMVVALAVAGPASFALLGVVSAARIADVVLTDGTTRASVNALYQVLPERSRLAAQSVVEGMGVPIAIGASGLLILGLDALPDGLAAMIVVLGVTCAVWSWLALRLYDAYAPALAGALGTRRLLDADAVLDPGAADAATVRGLLLGGDPRAAHLGLELVASLGVPVPAAELAGLAADAPAPVRLAALTALAATGDAEAITRLAADVPAAAASTDPGLRRAAAEAIGHVPGLAREPLATLLDDPDLDVRRAALHAVAEDDDPLFAQVLRALDEPSTSGDAMAAVGRLGDVALPALAAALREAGRPGAADGIRRRAARLLRAMSTPSPARDSLLVAHVDHRDRDLGRLALERIVGPAPATGEVAAELERVIDAEAAHAAMLTAASAAVPGSVPADEGTAVLRRALDDELALSRRRMAAAATGRFGRDRLGAAVAALAAGHGTALAREAIDVAAGSRARLVSAVLDGTVDPVPGYPDMDAVLRHIVEDPGDRWRSPWLRACALRVAIRRGTWASLDTGPARAAGDPVIDEELAAAASH